MQTFLPYPSFIESARCLDSRRLGKQRVECLQILNALLGHSKGWVNHPATVMWRGHVNELVDYAIVMCEEWIKRGYKDTLLPRFKHMESEAEFVCPPWLGHADFHDSHKSNLLRKAPFYYSQFNWNVPDNLPYVWPRS
jgi:hypothetical protein